MASQEQVLAKALEACKAALACEAERQRASRATKTGDEPPVELPPDRTLYLRIVELACEAVEMAEGRDGDGGPPHQNRHS